jgi:hypothetical protein
MSNAERQARHRARHVPPPVTAITRSRRAMDRRSRPQRWHNAVGELLALQAGYADWLAALPDSLRDSAVAAERSRPSSNLTSPPSRSVSRPAATAAIESDGTPADHFRLPRPQQRDMTKADRRDDTTPGAIRSEWWSASD